ncbi:hypothetical protein G4B88_008308 [Cannabis sativa]|uniref:Ribosomal protein L34e superfamily protein n=1 Tax=Cannabis sativa TaxID=3483 RepID=A0A7J6G7K3_CANSA|nr:hypothetical protein G4B88_008308 [Cannabis sativa]
MRHMVFTTTTATTMPASSSATSSSSSSPSSKAPKSSNPNPNSLLCKHSPSATLDLLILILVLFSGTFLVTSYFSYIFNSLSLLLSTSTFHIHLHHQQLPYIIGFVVFFLLAVLFVEFCCGSRSRKCDKPGCQGLKNAMEFDLKLQKEDAIKNGSKEIDRLPWKGGSEANPDYECLRSELRKMAPPNGRAILLFRTRCGCPVAKLEGWGPKRGRRHKKALASVAPKGGDHN